MILKLKRLWCDWFFHPHFHVVHACSENAWCVWCERCDRYYGVHFGEEFFIPWTADLCFCGKLDPSLETREGRGAA